MLGKIAVPKYGDLESPLITVTIGNITISNVLVDLGVSINIMTYETIIKFGCIEMKPTSIVLQLEDRSTIVPYGIIEDMLVMVDSSEYPIDFMIVKIKSNMARYIIILGRPWLAIADAYIECRIGKMSISNGDSTKNIIIYTPTQPKSIENPL